MSTPIEALAQEKERARNEWFGHRCQHSTPQATSAADGFNAGFEAGAKAASGQCEARIKELESALLDAVDELYTVSRATVFDGQWIQKENASACDGAYTRIRKALSGAGKGEGHE